MAGLSLQHGLQFSRTERPLLGYEDLLQLILNMYFYCSLVLVPCMHSSLGNHSKSGSGQPRI